MNRENRIISWITDNLTSLVRITGLLVSIGVLTLLCSCREKEAYYVGRSSDTAEQEAIAAGDLAADAEEVTNTSSSKENEAQASKQGNNMTDSAAEDLELEGTITIDEEENAAMVVHLCGAVNNPGVYELASDSRVIDAIIKAGGFSDEACEDALNLAMAASDGSRIYVPTKEEMKNSDTYVTGDNSTFIQGGSGTGISGPGSKDDTSDSKININTASKEKLMTLSGIGATRADSIIAYREEHGAFKSVEDIMNVSGIKSGSFEKIKDDITVN